MIQILDLTEPFYIKDIDKIFYVKYANLDWESDHAEVQFRMDAVSPEPQDPPRINLDEV